MSTKKEIRSATHMDKKVMERGDSSRRRVFTMTAARAFDIAKPNAAPIPMSSSASDSSTSPSPNTVHSLDTRITPHRHADAIIRSNLSHGLPMMRYAKRAVHSGMVNMRVLATAKSSLPTATNAAMHEQPPRKPRTASQPEFSGFVMIGTLFHAIRRPDTKTPITAVAIAMTNPCPPFHSFTFLTSRDMSDAVRADARMHSAAFRLLLFAVFCLFADPPELDCALSSADLVREPPLESSVDLTDCVSVKHMLAAAPLEKSSWVVC
mmetsp:Transcript_17794/g.46607  ORF Transcript_17794/g.46607 Transcript_17794/m.46607 type:complete len:265 (+) Transcript_17794:905-1699(+)